MADAARRRVRSGRITQKWLLPLLVLAVAAIGLMVLELPEPAAPPPAEETRDNPDLIMSGAEIYQYRGTGTLQYVLRAAEIRHFDARALTRMNAPQLTLYADDEAPWEGEAAFGYLRRAARGSGEEELVFLRQDVRLEQRRADGSHLKLTAPSLYLYPEREYAETEQDVMIESQVGTTRAEGMQADLKSGLVRLTSRQGSPVHTILLPDQFK